MTLKNALLAFSLLAAVPAYAGTFTQTNLVSDGAIPAANTDPNLKNPWGVSYAPGGAFWVSDNNSGLTTLYNSSGAVQGLVVTIPPAPGTKVLGSPSGQAYNPSSTDFVVKKGKESGPAAFLFATEDGTISGWSPSVNATTAIVAANLSS